MNRLTRLVAGLVLVLGMPAFVFAVEEAPDLGDAEALGLFAMPDGDASDAPCLGAVTPCGRITSASNLTTNIGIYDNGRYEKTSGGVVTGNVFLGTGATFQIGGAVGSGGTIVPGANLTDELNDALAANLAAAGLTTTEVLGLIDNGFIDGDATNDNMRTLTGNSTLNVYSVTDINLSGTHKLILSGNANEYFIFNISGDLNLSGSSAILVAGGTQVDHVLFNVLGEGDDVDITAGGATLADNIGIYGTILAPDRDVRMHGRQIGAIFANDIQIGSGAYFFQNTYDGPETPETDPDPDPPPPGIVPEPGTMMLMGLGLTGFGAFSRRRKI